jgi:ComF family protein
MRAYPFIKTVLSDIVKATRILMFPPTCLLCKSLISCIGAVCPTCWCQIRFIERPFCEVMGTPFAFEHGEGIISSSAIADPPPFHRARSVVTYGVLIRKLVQRLKYYDHIDLAPWMAAWMARAGAELITDCDLIVPVPLYRWRYFFRQFNQSTELGRALSLKVEKPLSTNVLFRVRKTKPQVGLVRRQREENVKNAFQVPLEMHDYVKGKTILLIDDVYTTGATVKAATKSLMQAGAKSVDILTFACVISGDFSR